MKLLNKSLSIFKLFKSKLTKSYFPFLVMLNITNRCNLKCTYCFSKFYERGKEELNIKQIFSLINELASMGAQRIAISGGEPLLRDDLSQIIKFIKGKGIECGLNTNGILVPTKINEIKLVDSICISLDGPEKIHDHYRGEGSFRKAMEAVEVIKKHRIPLHINTVLTKNNYNYIDFILELAREKKALIQISPLYNQFYGEKNENFPELLSVMEYRQTINKILDYKDKGYPIFYSKKNYFNILNWPDYNHDRIMNAFPDFKHIKCWAGKYMCSIEANGDVYPCGYFTGHHTLNYKEYGFKKAFENINNHNCHACLWACYSEFNLLLNLNISALLNQFINILFERNNILKNKFII